MKFTLICITALFAVISFGQQPKDDLAKLRDGYTKAVERATAPITATYIAELKKLLDKHTKAGNLDAALTVKTELDTVSKSAFGSGNGSLPATAESASLPKTNRQLEEYLLGTRWAISRIGAAKPHEFVTFMEKGEAKLNNRPTEQWKWQVLQDRTVKLQFVEIKFSDDLRSFTATWGSDDVTGAMAEK